MDRRNADIRKIIGARVRQERIKRRLTIETLAEKLDLSPSFLGCVERGERSLSIENLVHISDFFDVTIDSLAKNTKSDSSRIEEMTLLLKELDEGEYLTVYKIAQTTKDHLKNSIHKD